MAYCGLLNIFKLPGMSSHDVVNRVRLIAGMKRVGHTGTLDPAACGVLPICLGPATRLAEYIAAGPKSYRAEFCLGIATDSGDAMGDVTAQCDAAHLTEARIVDALAQFTGVIRQRPPRHSAIWIGGQRAYDLARAGQEVEMPEREVTIYRFTPVRVQLGATPRLLAEVVVSKGTYIRSLADNLGATLGVGGYLSFLARTQVGDCTLERSFTLEEVAEAADAGQFATVLRAADAAVTYLPAVSLPPEARWYRQGTPADVEAAPDLYRVYDQDGEFVGLGRVEDGVLRTVVNLTHC